MTSPDAYEEHSVGDIIVARVPAVTAACALVRAADFNTVGGFSENYVYGCEDVDLALKINQSIKLSAVVMLDDPIGHDEMSTRSTIDRKERGIVFDRNHEILKMRWSKSTQAFYLQFKS